MDPTEYLRSNFSEFVKLSDPSQMRLSLLYRRWLEKANEEELAEINEVIKRLMLEEVNNGQPIPKRGDLIACFAE